MSDISVLYLSQVTILPGMGRRAHTHDYWHFSLRLEGMYEKSALDVPFDRPVFTYIPGARRCVSWKTPRAYFHQTSPD